MKKTDIAVIGGGASGMTAAITAARSGKGSVCLIEAQQRIGRKLLSTGNGRCNLTNTDISDAHYRSRDMDAVRAALDAVSQERVSDMLHSLGLEYTEESGRIYPRSEQAASVLDMLRMELEHSGVETLCGCRVRSVSRQNGGFVIEAGGERISARRVILACGSPAAPQLGGCDDGIRIASSLGHRMIEQPSAALAPVTVRCEHLPSLKGVRVKCRMSLYSGERLVHSECGELQFNDTTLSGIVVFQMSSRIARLRGGDIALSADILPECDRDSVRTILRERRSSLGYLRCEDVLTGLFNRRIGVALMKQAGVKPMTKPANELTDGEIEKIADLIKDWRFPVTGVCGFKQAQVMSGGVRLCDIDPDMQSRRCRGVYICGEMLDCDGDCGGYNLHWAWLTGIRAGEAASESLSKEEHGFDDIEQY